MQRHSTRTFTRQGPICYNYLMVRQVQTEKTPRRNDKTGATVKETSDKIKRLGRSRKKSAYSSKNK